MILRREPLRLGLNGEVPREDSPDGSSPARVLETSPKGVSRVCNVDFPLPVFSNYTFLTFAQV